MACTSCSGGGSLGYQVRVSDVRHLYNPSLTVIGSGAFKRAGCQKIRCSSGGGANCREMCQMPPPCVERFKSYASRVFEIPQIRSYEEQPWFRNRAVQKDWHAFVDQLVTPGNIGAKVCPGPDDWQFKCHKARSLIGPSVECVWDLPDQDPCAMTSYGRNRDWRRYNEDQRMEASDIRCGCRDEPQCLPFGQNRNWPPYMGQKFGPRYMAWSQPTGFMFPRTKPFHYESRLKC